MPNDDAEARAIAARLSDRDVALVMQPAFSIVASERELAAMRTLWTAWGSLGQGRVGYDLTDLGLRVRAALVEMEGGGDVEE